MMQRQLTCIVCPNGCRLTASRAETGEVTAAGGLCPKGEAFARAELTNPTRTLTTTVRTRGAELPALPVRTEGEIPKGCLFQAIAALAQVEVSPPVACGQVVVKDLLGTGVDVIATCRL